MKLGCPIRREVLLMAAVLCAAGCSGAPGEEQAPLDLNPSSQEEARLTLQRIRELHDEDPVAALDAARRLGPRLDALNHLIARVEVAPEHFVDFYELKPDGILVSESGRLGEGSVLGDRELAAHSSAELYRQLTGGAVPPAALLRAQGHREVSSGSRAPAWAAVEPEARSSAAEASLLNSFCYPSGDFVKCWLNVAGNGWASANSKSSFAKVEAWGTVAGIWFSYELSVNGSWNINPGYWRSFSAYSGSYATCPPLVACGNFEYYIRNHRWDTFNNAGGGYHATLAFRWNCSYGLCGSP
ncbi:hypothetical protein SAMN05443572_106333 [Myxococcus fulvus]|uniref:Lipoprotein n=2 Tax=Myxococcus fulvus TaxID=33 RepID=A0ABY1CM02_MYXFU|nr:hypothetical protein SAMN05443572_106333 [Myxococcus fulvus]